MPLRDSWIVIAAVAAALAGPPARAQQSRCADCHFATPNAPNPRHVADWDLSDHARNGVGCEQCHGGNATTFDHFAAHQSILRPGHHDRPTAPHNLARTCGRCHIGEFTAFQKSRHRQLLADGDRRAPTCATCHGEVAAYLPSPKTLEHDCASCHGANKRQPRVDDVARARRLLENVSEVRASLKAADSLIRRIKPSEARAPFEDLYRQAEVPLLEAVAEAHAFVFDRADERLPLARRRAGALLDRLANPPTSRSSGSLARSTRLFRTGR